MRNATPKQNNYATPLANDDACCLVCVALLIFFGDVDASGSLSTSDFFLLMETTFIAFAIDAVPDVVADLDKATAAPTRTEISA